MNIPFCLFTASPHSAESGLIFQVAFQDLIFALSHWLWFILSYLVIMVLGALWNIPCPFKQAPKVLYLKLDTLTHPPLLDLSKTQNQCPNMTFGWLGVGFAHSSNSKWHQEVPIGEAPPNIFVSREHNAGASPASLFPWGYDTVEGYPSLELTSLWNTASWPSSCGS